MADFAAMTLNTDERRKLREGCVVVYPGFRTPSPAEEFRLIGEWCAANNVAHDVYGEGELIGGFESKIAALLGQPAAAFMPSGVMAQLVAVRIWTQRAGLGRFGMHPTSHLMIHEQEAYQALFGLHGAPVGNRLAPIAAADVGALAQPLACLLVELPIREAGGQLPTWAELEALKRAARQRALPLHLDGARLWESRAFYGRTHAEIVDGFASVYVSTYKGLGGLAGAVLAGETDFIGEARLWRRRMGGTLVHQSPMIASAAMRLDARLGALDACYARTLTLAKILSGLPGIRINPARPHANMLHIFFDASADALMDRRDAIAARDGVWVIGEARPTDTPGWSCCEMYVGDTLVELDDRPVVSSFTELLG